MTAKKLPVVGMRIAVYQIDGVDWPGKEVGIPLSGVVTAVEALKEPAWSIFYVMPDEPDLSRNDGGITARVFDAERGWMVYNPQKWKQEKFIIHELELS